jgi:hypothetical protein
VKSRGKVAEDGEGLVDVQLPRVRLPLPKELDLLRGVTSLCSSKSGAAAETVPGEFGGVVPGLLEALVESPEGEGAREWSTGGGDEEGSKGGSGRVDLAISSVTCDGTSGSSRGHATEDASATPPDIGFTGLDVAKQGLVSDVGDTSLREIDGGVKLGAISDSKLAAAHKSGPCERERSGEHPAVMIVGELCEDISENLAGNGSASFTGS